MVFQIAEACSTSLAMTEEIRTTDVIARSEATWQSVALCRHRTEAGGFYYFSSEEGGVVNSSIVTFRISAIAFNSISVAARVWPSSLERLLGSMSTPINCNLETKVICLIRFCFRIRSIFAPQIFLFPYGAFLGFKQSPSFL